MQNYKMLIQYEGTKYNGWQRQGNTKNTIQGKIEDILLKLCGKPVEVHGSGRTDAGVHAMGQVVSFKADISLSTREITAYFNSYLPSDIAVIATEVAEERFHARLNAISKTYVYRIWRNEIPDVFGRRTRYTFTEPLDVDKMREAAGKLCGTHDFMAFCSNKKSKKSTVRTLYSIDIRQTKNELKLTFRGDGFLYNMVRIMTGTLLEIGEGKKKAGDIEKIFKSLSRENAGATAPAEGLTLAEVEY
ncbi:MAG: tRNA pseudouridine(38-40) synthase TruA [Bacillota bacterium]|nr:tRNA pseudouridine(38-40) synthase TruA [Bacillota bacterium]